VFERCCVVLAREGVLCVRERLCCVCVCYVYVLMASDCRALVCLLTRLWSRVIRYRY